MWINYRFRHAVRWEKPIPIAGESITVSDLDCAIIAARLSPLKTKKKGRRCLAEVRLVVYNAETGEEYSDDNEEIPANTSVIVRLLTQWSNSFLQGKRGSQSKAELSSCTTEGECLEDNAIRARTPFKSAWHYLKTPPGYICHRCNVLGHYIQACPTNDDPSYDIKGSKYSTGAYKVSCEKDAVSSTITLPFRRFPKELNCPLCKEAMKEAVLMRCCFSSFCNKCIRDCMTLKSVCACGATNVTVDDIVPNKTLRETVKRLLSLTSGSSEEDTSCCLQARGPGTDFYSETEVPLPSTMESAPTKASKESVTVSGVTYAGTCKQLHVPVSALTATDVPALPSRLETPASTGVQQKYTIGDRKRVSNSEYVCMIKSRNICVAFVCLQVFVYVVLCVPHPEGTFAWSAYTTGLFFRWLVCLTFISVPSDVFVCISRVCWICCMVLCLHLAFNLMLLELAGGGRVGFMSFHFVTENSGNEGSWSSCVANADSSWQEPYTKTF